MAGDNNIFFNYNKKFPQNYNNPFGKGFNGNYIFDNGSNFAVWNTSGRYSRGMRYGMFGAESEASSFERFMGKYIKPLSIGILGGFLLNFFAKKDTPATQTPPPKPENQTPQNTGTDSSPSLTPNPEADIDPAEAPEAEADPEIEADPTSETPEISKPQAEKTQAQLLTDALASGRAKASIEGKATGLGKDYNGEIILPKGQTLESGKFPSQLRMTLPAAYGGKTMVLNLIDEENGIYETNAHDRRFQISIDDDGNISVHSVDVEELRGKLEAHQAEYKRIAEEKARLAAEQAENERKILTDEAQAKENAENIAEGKSIAQILYDDMQGTGTSSTFNDDIDKINKNNVASVIMAYYDISPDESLAECIMDEWGLSKENTRLPIIEKIFNNLIARANELGIDTSQYTDGNISGDKNFYSAYQFAKLNPIVNYKRFDEIFYSLASAINGKTTVTSSDRTQISKMSTGEKQEQVITDLRAVQTDAKAAFEAQKAEDGWAGRAVDKMSALWLSQNRAELVEEDLNTFNSQVTALENCTTEAEFEDKFKELFGVKYDAELVLEYEQRKDQIVEAQANKFLEDNFNSEMKLLLNGKPLEAEREYEGTEEFPELKITTKEQVFDREFNKLAQQLDIIFAGTENQSKGKEILNNTLTQFSTLEEKYNAMQKIAKEYSETMHKNVITATNGKGYNAFIKECESMYSATFGMKNDIAKRVNDYNISQQTGAMILKSGIKVGASIGLALIPGVGPVLLAAGTTAVSASVDLTDRGSSEAGLQEGEILTILKNAGVDGLSVLAGAQLTKVIGAIPKTPIKVGTQMLGDVAIGAGAEYAQTGEITLGGVAFQCFFSAAGSLVAMKPKGQAPKAGAKKANVDPAQHSLERKQVNDSYHKEKVQADKKGGYNRKRTQEAEKLKVDLNENPITEADINAYLDDIAYQPVPEADMPAYQAHQEEVAAQYAEAHQVKNNLDAKSEANLKKAKAELDGTAPKEAPVKPATAENTADITKLENDINLLNKKIQNRQNVIKQQEKFGKDTSKLEKELNQWKKDLQAKTAELDALKNPKPTEPVAKKTAEPVAEKPAEPVAEKPTEPVAEKPTEPIAEKPTEPVAEKPTEPVAEKPTEPVAEKPTEAAPKTGTESDGSAPAPVRNNNANESDYYLVGYLQHEQNGTIYEVPVIRRYDDLTTTIDTKNIRTSDGKGGYRIVDSNELPTLELDAEDFDAFVDAKFVYASGRNEKAPNFWERLFGKKEPTGYNRKGELITDPSDKNYNFREVAKANIRERAKRKPEAFVDVNQNNPGIEVVNKNNNGTSAVKPSNSSAGNTSQVVPLKTKGHITEISVNGKSYTAKLVDRHVGSNLVTVEINGQARTIPFDSSVKIDGIILKVDPLGNTSLEIIPSTPKTNVTNPKSAHSGQNAAQTNTPPANKKTIPASDNVNNNTGSEPIVGKSKVGDAELGGTEPKNAVHNKDIENGKVNKASEKPSEPTKKPVNTMTENEIYDEMDELRNTMKNMRNDATSDFDAQIKELQQQKAQLEADYAAKRQNNIKESNQITENLADLHEQEFFLKRRVKAQEIELRELEGPILQHEDLLKDMKNSLKKQNEALLRHTEDPLLKPVYVIEAKVSPSNHGQNVDIEDFIDRFNKASMENKQKIIDKLEDKLNGMKNKYQKTQIDIDKNNAELQNINNRAQQLYARQKEIDNPLNTQQDIDILENQIKELENTKNNIVDDILNSPMYKACQDRWHELQNRLREIFSSNH